ncbi:uncharacterized protein LOC126833831 isoform X1 [Adelges cooleyi]|uniref:uncharacterized protein LOC126833831 isoform X1 n=1 Tax=Adelges cooleyi TaxID=133065 RepID=UPI00217FE875|nr:uncharacterized protein LOC126833831 isoform X1 [Adelges cooleyi]XP_050421347.1 uncharacterized protein LOC126833831 isoform X1 [Adelges cooleyi]
MSANICFIAAVLAATAFTLASSCPNVDTCKCDKPAYTPGQVPFFDYYEGFGPAHCKEFFGSVVELQVDVLPCFEAYVSVGGEPEKLKYKSALNEYYTLNPDQCGPDSTAIVEYIISITPADVPENGDCDKALTCPCGAEIFGAFETCYSEKPVVAFFEKRQMESVLGPYTNWKANRDDPKYEADYIEALYAYYGGQDPSVLAADCEAFPSECATWQHRNLVVCATETWWSSTGCTLCCRRKN